MNGTEGIAMEQHELEALAEEIRIAIDYGDPLWAAIVRAGLDGRDETVAGEARALWASMTEGGAL